MYLHPVPEPKTEQHEEEADDDNAPSLTYDSDADEDEAVEEATPLVHQEANVGVRNRADTGSFQEKVETELGVVEHQTAQKTNEEHQINVETRSPRVRPLSYESTSEGSGSKRASVSSQQSKHEIKLLALKRPEVLTGGNVPINAHAVSKHEVKIMGLQRPIERK